MFSYLASIERRITSRRLPADVQDEAIPLIMGGGDVLVAAETGSGKTGAFALPAIHLAHEIRRTARDRARKPKELPAEIKADEPKPAAASASPGRADDMSSKLRLSPDDRSPLLAIDPSGRVCQCRHPHNWGGARSQAGLRWGKVYFEAKVEDEGLARVGWSTAAGSLDLGTDRAGWGFGGTGKKSHGRRFDAYGTAYGLGDVIGCLLDVRQDGSGGSVSFSRNGECFGEAFSLPQGTGVLYPTVCMKNAQLKLSFGGPYGGALAHEQAARDMGYVPLGDPESMRGTAAELSASRPSGAGAAHGGKSAGGGAASGSLQRSPLVLILEPSKDLAEQTYRVCQQLAAHVSDPPVRSVLAVGGGDTKAVTRSLREGVEIVVGTLGKLMDLVGAGRSGRRGGGEGRGGGGSKGGGAPLLDLSAIRVFVLDEADRLFGDSEASEQVSQLFDRMDKGVRTEGGAKERLQVCFFSATLHAPTVREAADSMCQNPVWVDLKGKDAVPDTVHHVVVPVDPYMDYGWARPDHQVVTDAMHRRDKVRGRSGDSKLTPEEASEGLKRLKPAMLVSLLDQFSMPQCIVFCRTNLDCSNLEKYLVGASGGRKFRGQQEKGAEGRYSCAVVGGRRSTSERRKALEAFRSGDVRVLICTDAAARGIDVKELPFMVNMTLPDEPENYIHRIGRVGRADRMGLAISLVSAGPPEKVWFFKDRKEDYTNTKLWHKGGGAIWYDECRCLRAIERRIDSGRAEEEPEAELKHGVKGGAGEGAASSSSSPSSSSAAAAAAGTAAEPIPRMPGRPSGAHVHSGGAVFSSYKYTPPPHLLAGGYYGEEKAVQEGPSTHVLSIQEQVQCLAGMEVQSQLSYLALSRFVPSREQEPPELVSEVVVGGHDPGAAHGGAGTAGAAAVSQTGSFGVISSRGGGALHVGAPAWMGGRGALAGAPVGVEGLGTYSIAASEGGPRYAKRAKVGYD